MNGVIWLIILPLFAAFVLGLIEVFFDWKIEKLAFIVFTLQWGLALFVVREAFKEPIVYSLGSWHPEFGINLVVDSFSAFMVLLISSLFLLVVFYSTAFIEQDREKYYELLLFLLAGSLGMVMTADLFNLYVFFEITSIASYALIAINKSDYSIEGAFKYLILGTIGGLFVLIGIVLTYQVTGSLSFGELAVEFREVSSGIRYTILGLYLVGFGVKAALIPLHAWLPDAYTEAFAPVSALSSAVVIKTALYSLMRIVYTLYGVDFIVATPLRSLFIYWGVATFLIAHLLAYQQTSLRRLLGYSSIAQMGYIVIGVGVGTEQGIIAANYHILNHSVMKAALFLAAGIFTAATGKYTIESLKGLGKKLPYISFFFTIAAFAIIGLPPFNGFISKWLIIQSALGADYMIAGFMVLVGTVLSLTYYLKAIKLLYTTPNEEEAVEVENKEVFSSLSWRLKLPAAVLSIFCFLLGVLPHFPLRILERTVSLIVNHYPELLLGG